MGNQWFCRISLHLLIVAIMGLGSGCELLIKTPTSPKMPNAFEYPLLVDKEAEEFPKAVMLAEKLGYTPGNLSVKKTNCSPSSFLMPTVGDCYLYFIFTTEQTLSEFGAQLPTLAWKETDYRILDGTDLFSLINIGGHVGEYKRLSLADNDGSTVEQRNAMPKFQRHYRQFEDTTGKLIQIDFYETALLKPALDLGSSPVQGNVVVIGFDIGLARLQ